MSGFCGKPGNECSLSSRCARISSVCGLWRVGCLPSYGRERIYVCKVAGNALMSVMSVCCLLREKRLYHHTFAWEAAVYITTLLSF